MQIADLEKAKQQSPTLGNLFSRYADCLAAQIFQAGACNAAHSIEQRTAKWLISAVERTGGPDIPLTQEQLAVMLAVGRSYISRVLRILKQRGILEFRRGSCTSVTSMTCAPLHANVMRACGRISTRSWTVSTRPKASSLPPDYRMPDEMAGNADWRSGETVAK